jgi:hypothetical protein
MRLINFIFTELSISMYQTNKAQKLLDFHLLRLEVEVVQKTYNMTVMLRIGGISLVHFDPVGSVCLLNTPMAAGDSEYLFTVLYVDVSHNLSIVLKTVRRCEESKYSCGCGSIICTKLQYFIAEIAIVTSLSHHQSCIWIDYVGNLTLSVRAEYIYSAAPLKPPVQTEYIYSAIFIRL